MKVADKRNKANGGSGRSPSRIRWVFRASANQDITLTEEQRDEEAMYLYGELIDHCEIFAFQLESAPTTGYVHFQGYFELIIKKQYTWIQKNIRHFEYIKEAKGTPKQAWEYSTKNETRIFGPWTLGQPRASESKNKTEDFVKAIKNGMTDEQLWEEHPSMMARMEHVPHRIRTLKVPVRTEELEVYVFYGEPGTGKSRMVRELYPDVYVIPFSQKVWLTHRGALAKVVCLEDFDGNMQLKQFNRLIDRYPEEVETKGGFLWWMPNIVFIITNAPPHTWWGDDGRQNIKDQVFRRISACYDFNGFDYSLWQKERKMPPKLTVQELEEKYKPKLTLLQLQANHRMSTSYKGTFRPAVIRKSPSVQRKGPYSPGHVHTPYVDLTNPESKAPTPLLGAEVLEWGSPIDEPIYKQTIVPTPSKPLSPLLGDLNQWGESLGSMFKQFF
nr:MAG: replication associated protein [Cressdnaviricota sp.]